ncbi:trimethyltridecatetraene synthase-like isoform X2 [Telopea speciosissima]|uniref:trimethyltridecatetraene synthase-like isoform X2 n=1 Tax=Telopea speciosissima TaxID=54955 RepID=UPI001CC66367|nr:trimethyltridecatetraene synthase-like isoform X2 [Telopea speciosissima]
MIMVMGTDTLSLAVLLAAIAVIILLLFFFPTHLRRRQPNPPPGPKPWPIIGNLNLIGSLPHRSIHSLSQQYGPLIQVYYGSVPVVVASSVSMAKQLLKTHDHNFASRPKNAAGKHTFFNYSAMTWSSYGPYWRFLRKLYLTELFTPKRLDLYEKIRMEEMGLLLWKIYDLSGKEIRLKTHLWNANLSFVSRIVMGKKFSDEPVEALEELKKMFEELFFLNGVLDIGDVFPWLGFLDLKGYVKQMKDLGKRFDGFLEKVIYEHEMRRRGVEILVENDMVDVLMRLADDPNLEVKLDRTALKGITLELLAGSTESSIVSVEWAISLLLKNPEIFKKATEELDRVVGRERWVEEKDIPHLPYIDSIMKETMRIHPVSPLLTPHQAQEDCEVAGYTILAGTRVHVSTWTIGKDPTLWDAPHEFRPERFIGKAIEVKGRDFELLPFGSGRRMCPGYALGLKMIQSYLANLIHGFLWKLPGEMQPQDLNMDEVYGLSAPKKIPLFAMAEPRLPPHLYCS